MAGVHLAIIPAASADVKLAGLFSDGMVLQRETRPPVWGTADPGEVVTVSIARQQVQTFASEEGKWLVRLAPLPTGGPYEMTVSGKNTIVVHNVAVGDVWLCAGQSNMVFRVAQGANADEEIASANYPLIRHFKVASVVAAQPSGETNGQWQEANPENVGGFSAVAYFFGRDVHRQLGVPIGLINSSWGGTAAQAWTSLPALQSEPQLKPLLERWDERMARYEEATRRYQDKLARWRDAAARSTTTGLPEPKKPGEPPDELNPARPAGLYNGMIAPLIPYAIKGVIWYQGESNAGNAAAYRVLFPLLIRSWRATWGEGDFPFLFVQLPNYMQRKAEPEESAWAEIREAQLMALALPQTAMAVTIDVGEADNIHPKDKQDVGARLAIAALGSVYKQRAGFSGPLYERMEIQDNAVRLYFKYADGGLAAMGGGPLRGFAIAGDDHKFVWANARIDGDTVIVSSDQVPHPVAVRYAWANNPEANLFNGDGLPASPFRTDGPQ